MSVIETAKPKYVPLAERFFDATGFTPPSNTISRIAQSGRLEAVKILGRWMCTEEAFQAYMTVPTKTRNQETPKTAVRTRSESARIRAQKEATDYLEVNGIV